MIISPPSPLCCTPTTVNQPRPETATSTLASPRLTAKVSVRFSSITPSASAASRVEGGVSCPPSSRSTKAAASAVSTPRSATPLGPKKTRRAHTGALSTSTRRKPPHSTDQPASSSSRRPRTPAASCASTRSETGAATPLSCPLTATAFTSSGGRRELTRWWRCTPGVSWSLEPPEKTSSGMMPSVVPGVADAIGWYLSFPNAKGSRAASALRKARMKSDLPTLAAPSTYTSRPLRVPRIARTAPSTPRPVRLETSCTSRTFRLCASAS
mmetsp:Transcript_6257/g.16326  ORF Transcript_6257/g.16326 Transcript_6257/m.16326 type:complete len:269 (+) Transcript_6257:485-1291(+)